MTRRLLLALLPLVAVTTGCRCGAETDRRTEDAGASPVATSSTPQPKMPAGMLGPAASSSSTPAAARLKLARGVKSGAWTELQLADPNDAPTRTTFDHWKDDSRFLSLDAVTLMHGPFARALPGFDLFLPRLFAGDALTRLAAELDLFAKEIEGIPDAAKARARFGPSSELVRGVSSDAEWADVRATLSSTAREVAALARETAQKGRGLWVLGV